MMAFYGVFVSQNVLHVTWNGRGNKEEEEGWRVMRRTGACRARGEGEEQGDTSTTLNREINRSLISE